MSYIKYPRLHFSGKFNASPSTINNAPDNYDEKVYPSPNELQGAELYWNPKGDGGFGLLNCVVTRVDYSENEYSTTQQEDSIIGTPVTSLLNNFPLPSAMVDLDPYQQNVSEIWALNIQAGDNTAQFKGAFAPIAFYAIWQQCQDKDAPHSSASGSGVYQSTLKDVVITGDTSGSRFLQMLETDVAKELSINFNLTRHNNKPPIYSFNDTTFKEMAEGANPVPQNVLDKILPMQGWVQNIGQTLGDIPTQDFTLFMLQQMLPTNEHNAHIDKIFACCTSKDPYIGATPEPFLHGSVTGTVGEASDSGTSYYVPTRMLCPFPTLTTNGAPPKIYFTPFVINPSGTSVTVNLGNSLSTNSHSGFTPYTTSLGELTLVAFPNGVITTDNALLLATIPYSDPDFIDVQAGFFTATGITADYSSTPLGIISKTLDTNGTHVSTIIVAENPDGYYMRADQFVYRMNPSETQVPTPPRGANTTLDVYVTQWGQPAGSVAVDLSLMLPNAARAYTRGTLGTGGTLGVDCMSIPQNAIELNGTTISAPGHKLNVTSTSDSNGKASFDIAATAPGNPRRFVDGQVYLLEYGFNDAQLQSNFIQDINDKVSILVYDETIELSGEDILAKWGRLYKIMYFLADEVKVTDISFRKVIKQMLELPFDEVKHMPLTRDLGLSSRTKVTDWINSMDQS